MTIAKRLGVAGGLALMLAGAGCSGDAARLLYSGSPAYDGAWVGQFSVSTRTRECFLSRGGLRLSIKQGQIEGVLRQPEEVQNLLGVVLEDGTVEGMETYPRYESRKAIFTGTLSEAEGGGTWTNENCNGRWSLRKIR